MNKLLFTIVALMLAVSPLCRAESAKDGAPVATFTVTSYDFGNIPEEGGPVEYSFEVTNTGTAPLVIISAKAQCGCTRPTFPQKPIAPGKSDVIKVKYLPKGRPGEFVKEVKVKTNDKQHRTVRLKISGMVIPEHD